MSYQPTFHRLNDLKATIDKELARERWAAEWASFEIEVLFLTPDHKGSLVDMFEVEGITNAMKVFDYYRSIGHSLQLRKLRLHAGGKKIKAVNFKY